MKNILRNPRVIQRTSDGIIMTKSRGFFMVCIFTLNVSFDVKQNDKLSELKGTTEDI